MHFPRFKRDKSFSVFLSVNEDIIEFLGARAPLEIARVKKNNNNDKEKVLK